ncbi:MAG: MBL fold metallo-hydrolase [Mycobacterium leprae]
MLQLSAHLHLHRDTCNVYVVTNGAEAVLIDCGDGSVLDQLPSLGVERVQAVLLTHHHRDQAQGLNRVVAAGAAVWVPHAEQDFFHSVEGLWQGRELYNSYNNRQDRFSLAESVPVEGTLQDYSTVTFAGHSFVVVPTPGHTTGSVSFIAEIDGRRVAFTGDLLAGPGKVWSLAATQWSYNGGEGIPGSILSLLDLKERQLARLLPAHGEPMADPDWAIAQTVERLTALRDLRRQNPRLFLLREKPFEQITPHLLRSRTSMATYYVLLSESGKALFIDFGYDFMFGPASGADRASRRPWLYTLPALKQQYGVSKIDAVIPTHYHDDHVAGCNLLRAVEGTQVWAAVNFADVLANPSRYDLPCLWYDPIPVDRVLPLGEPIQWEEYEITLYPQAGHTYYAVAIAFTVDGKRVVAQGDQNADGDGLFLNYVYKNGFRPQDYRESAQLYRHLKPDLMISGHWDPIWVQPGYLEQLLARGETLERLHQELLLPEAAASAWLQPYQVTVAPGATTTIEVVVHNPFANEAEAEVALRLPSGWKAEPVVAKVTVDPETDGSAYFKVTAPAAPARRVCVTADVTIDGRRFGELGEALFTVTD